MKLLRFATRFSAAAAAVFIFAGALAPVSGGCGSSGNSGVDASAGGETGGGGTPEGSSGFDVPVQKPVDAFSLDDAGATSTCKALKAYADCNMTDPCAPVDYKDCIAFDGIYSLAGRKAMSACYGAPSACSTDAGNGVFDCLFQASINAAPDTAAKKLASDFCNACPSNSSSCATDFFSVVAGDAGAIGVGAQLGLTLAGDGALAMIDATCTFGLTGTPDQCIGDFISCASAIINPGQCSGMVAVDSGVDGGGPTDALVADAKPKSDAGDATGP